jgi:hypothetical protein
MQATRLRAQADAAEHEHGGARRDGARDDSEPLRELLLRGRDPEARAGERLVVVQRIRAHHDV